MTGFSVISISVAVLFLGQISSAMSVSSSDCAVVGCGVLGTSLCKQLLESPEFASMKGVLLSNFISGQSRRILNSHLSFFIDQSIVTGITKTKDRHESILAQIGESDRFSLKTNEEVEGSKFDNVVFCAPPSGFEDYPAAVENCITNLWNRAVCRRCRMRHDRGRRGARRCRSRGGPRRRRRGGGSWGRR